MIIAREKKSKKDTNEGELSFHHTTTLKRLLNENEKKKTYITV
jgi:hypothetical protein